ncbi:hypothetical protein SALBM217S_01344 [Streptomyces griseoloalbus]
MRGLGGGRGEQGKSAWSSGYQLVLPSSDVQRAERESTLLTELLETHTQSASAPRERVNAQSRSTAPPILTRMLQTG